MALPTFQELLQAYSSVPGGADAIKSLVGGLERGREISSSIQEGKRKGAESKANIRKTEAEAAYYEGRDPQEEARIKAEAQMAAAKEKSQTQRDIASERTATMQELATIIEQGRNQRAAQAAGAQAEQAKVNAASRVAAIKPTKESFLAKAANFIAHPIDSLKPKPPTPQEQAMTFLQQKFQSAPAATPAPQTQAAPVANASPAEPIIHTYPSGRKVQYNPTTGQWEPLQ